MAAGELNLELTTILPDAQTPAAEEEELPPLPEELGTVGKNLIEALAEDQQVAKAFAAFCSAAYVKPDWAGAASEFLAELFSEHEDLLAELARIPDLIIELASGHITLTCMVAAHWAARGETQRLARLAEALITTQSKMAGTTAVVEVMLALATSLAITRYSRAEQLVQAAEPHATEEQQEALNEARLWLDSGRIVRGCSQEVRDLWEHRLRRSRQTWTWDKPEEREALLQLADHIDETSEGLTLFEKIVPSSWWDLAVLRAKQSAQPDKSAAISSPEEAPVHQPRSHSRDYGTDFPPVHDNLRGVPWNPAAFLTGTLLGMMSITGIYWATQPSWLFRPAATSLRAPFESKPTSSPAEKIARPAISSTKSPLDAWRKDSLKDLVKDVPELAPLAAAAKNGTWAKNEMFLTGNSITVSRTSSRYHKLLIWLHLDPPEDAEVRSKIPSLLADLKADESVLDLWKKLIYEGSPNADDIRNAAKQQIHSNSAAWTEPQRGTLMEIAGWGAPGNSKP